MAGASTSWRGFCEVSTPSAPPDPASAYAFGGFRRWLDKEGYPAIKPPWGTLNALDLETGRLLWKVPLGEYPALAAEGKMVVFSSHVLEVVEHHAVGLGADAPR